MLEVFRNSTQSIAVKVLLGLIVVVFVFLGVGGVDQSDRNLLVTVNGEKVTYQNFNRSYNNTLNRYRQSGQQLTDNQRSRIRKQTLAGLVNETLLIQSARQNGFSISEQEMANVVTGNPTFQTDSRFDQRKYTQYLKNEGVDEFQFEKRIQKRLLLEKYLRFLGGSIRTDKAFIQADYLRSNTEIKVQLLEFNPKLFLGKVQIDQKALEAYYKKNPKQFEKSQQFAIKYFSLTNKDLEKDIKVKERENRYYYKKHQSEFKTKGAFQSKHILIRLPQKALPQQIRAARTKATQIYEQLQKDPTKFAKLAVQHSADILSKNKGGNLGWLPKGSLSTEYEQALASANVGVLSKPFRTKVGFHVMELLGKKESTVKKFADVKVIIEKKVLEQKGIRRLRNQLGQLRTTIKKSTLEEKAKNLSKTVIASKEFDQAGFIPSVGLTRRLYQRLKKQKLNDQGVFVFSSKNALIYQLVKNVPAAPKPLKEVTKEIKVLASRAKSIQLAKQKLAESVTKIKTVASYQALVKELNAPLQVIAFKIRDRFLKTVGYAPNFVNEVLKMKGTQVVKSITSSQRDFLVLKLETIPAVLGKSERELKLLGKYMNESKTNMLFSQIVEKMKKDAKVIYNHQLITAAKI
ncbi:MAG: peptidyl-prolyl cis-trans isomerase D [bacterium]|jgi:peptidyl-prolyl cis-trans isomerase D